MPELFGLNSAKPVFVHHLNNGIIKNGRSDIISEHPQNNGALTVASEAFHVMFVDVAVEKHVLVNSFVEKGKLLRPIKWHRRRELIVFDGVDKLVVNEFRIP